MAAICPGAMSDADLERAAAWIETHRDKDSAWIIGRLALMDAEARVCRNMK